MREQWITEDKRGEKKITFRKHDLQPSKITVNKSPINQSFPAFSASLYSRFVTKRKFSQNYVFKHSQLSLHLA